MKVYHKLDELEGIKNPVLTTGTFDGVHLGHRKIIDNLRQAALKVNGESVLFTFYPHPRMVLSPADDSLQLLNTQKEKILLLENAGIDHLIIYPFSKEFAELTAEQFVENILVQAIGVKKVVIGYDHQFGKNREGNLAHLQIMSEKFGFNVQEIHAKDIDQVNISSTKIRNALLEGDIATANEFLGYTYNLTGVVVEGKKLGRTINFPTANLSVSYRHKLVPAIGVYAVNVLVSGRLYQGMMNIGLRPTVENVALKPVPEVHLFDFDGNLYETEITVFFKAKLRDEKKFSGIDQLKEQLENDKLDALKYLNNEA